MLKSCHIEKTWDKFVVVIVSQHSNRNEILKFGVSQQLEN